jgi:hypothetical protein
MCDRRLKADDAYRVLDIALEALLVEQRMKAKLSRDCSSEGNMDAKRQKLSSGEETEISSARAYSPPSKLIEDQKGSRSSSGSGGDSPNAPGGPSSVTLNSGSLTNKTKQNTDISKEPSSREKADNLRDSLLGRQVRKKFPGHGFFVGTVMEYRYPYFTVCYADGDKEDMNLTEVQKWLIL